MALKHTADILPLQLAIKAAIADLDTLAPPKLISTYLQGRLDHRSVPFSPFVQKTRSCALRLSSTITYQLDAGLWHDFASGKAFPILSAKIRIIDCFARGLDDNSDVQAALDLESMLRGAVFLANENCWDVAEWEVVVPDPQLAADVPESLRTSLAKVRTGSVDVNEDDAEAQSHADARHESSRVRDGLAGPVTDDKSIGAAPAKDSLHATTFEFADMRAACAEVGIELPFRNAAFVHVMPGLVCPIQEAERSRGESKRKGTSQVLKTLSVIGRRAKRCLKRKNAQER